MDTILTWLAISVVLTIVFNVAIRAFPGVQRAITRWLTSAVPPPGHGEDPGAQRRSGVRVIFPWRAMIVASVLLTVMLNVVVALF